MNFPLGPLNVTSLCAMAADAAQRLNIVNAKGGAVMCDLGWARRFLRKFPDLRKFKSSAIDVLRCNVATSERRGALFKLIRVVFERAKKDNPEFASEWNT